MYADMHVDICRCISHMDFILKPILWRFIKHYKCKLVFWYVILTESARNCLEGV